MGLKMLLGVYYKIKTCFISGDGEDLARAGGGTVGSGGGGGSGNSSSKCHINKVDDDDEDGNDDSDDDNDDNNNNDDNNDDHDDNHDEHGDNEYRLHPHPAQTQSWSRLQTLIIVTEVHEAQQESEALLMINDVSSNASLYVINTPTVSR